MCHVWPGITPLTVWDLPLPTWLRFAAEADAWSAEMQRTKPNAWRDG